MEVNEAILSRYSVRDFSPVPISREMVMKILETSTRSPSSSNSQPWEVFVAGSDTVERIRQKYQGTHQNEKGKSFQPPPGMTNRPSYIQERMIALRNERFKLLGLDPADPASPKVFAEWAARLYGVPLLIVICMDKALSNNMDYFSLGLFTQTICLSAQGYGIDSFIATAFISQPDIIRQELEIPENMNLITAVGLGYANKQNIINNFRSTRRPLQEVVRFKN